MPRPKCQRRIEILHGSRRFKPQGIPARHLEEVVLTRDELEAIRLADLEGLYQDQAAERMGVSRATFGRMVAGARKKVAAALVGGLMLCIGEDVQQEGGWHLVCPSCGWRWDESEPDPEKMVCPNCGAAGAEIWTPRGRGFRHRGQGGRGRGRRRGQEETT